MFLGRISHLIPQTRMADEEAALQGHCLGEGQQKSGGEEFLQNPSFIHRFVPKQNKTTHIKEIPWNDNAHI